MNYLLGRLENLAFSTSLPSNQLQTPSLLSSLDVRVVERLVWIFVQLITACWVSHLAYRPQLSPGNNVSLHFNCSKHTWLPTWTSITLFSWAAYNQQTTQSISGSTEIDSRHAICRMRLREAADCIWNMWPYITIYVRLSSCRGITGSLWSALGVSAL